MKTVVAAALGECVHVAGISNFLSLAEKAGWRTVFLGPAVSIKTVVDTAREEQADLVGVSYRLTPENGERLIAEFAEAADELHRSGMRFAFGGTPPVTDRVRKIGFFERIFDGSESSDAVLAYLKGQKVSELSEQDFPQNVIERVEWKAPYPLLRHHFGLPDLTATVEGVQKIAEAKALDVISLGVDQDAQENFFRPERQDPRKKGAGGVPVRSAEDYRKLYQASRAGNYPLMRTYSGTDDFIRLAEMYIETINIAWCAIPLFWFNQMDGRGPWGLAESIAEHQKVMAWYGQQDIPVELNEPHHWGMRDASDVVFVVSAFLSAYNARAFGVRDYIAQLMFNSPPGLSDAMDLAKMLAALDLIEPLRRVGDAQVKPFRIWRQTRTGLLSYPPGKLEAMSHLAASVYLQMALQPHIIHVVGYTEADHAATAEEVIESCRLAKRAIENAIHGQPEMKVDPRIIARRNHLVDEAKRTLQAIADLAKLETGDPYTDASNLARAVKIGILDAPQLKNNPFASGKAITRIITGACEAVDESGNPLTEADRITSLLLGANNE